MKNSPLPYTSTAYSLMVADLERSGQGWLLDGDIEQHSPATLALRTLILGKLLWFSRQKSLTTLGTFELKQFLVYLTRGHTELGGRWGDPHQTKPASPSTVQTYHRHLRTFFRWLVAQQMLEASPMEAVPSPIARPDQIQPFTPQQVNALLAAAKRSQQTQRDTALILYLLDTGFRASEVCALCKKDMDMDSRRCSVVGKGDKKRTVPFGKVATKPVTDVKLAGGQFLIYGVARVAKCL